MPLVTLAVATTPALLLSFLFWERCRFAAPAERFWSAFLIGAIMAIPAVTLALLLTAFLIAANDAVGAVGKAFIGAAVPEELAKFAAVAALYFRRDGTRDGAETIVAAVALAAGFAAIETLLYLGVSEHWGRTAIGRSVTALPAHVFCGAIMGACLARSVFSRHSRSWMASALLIPILLHGLYDSFVLLWDAGHSRESVAAGADGGDDLVQVFAAGIVLTLFAGGYLAHVLTRRFAVGALADRIGGHPFVPLRGFPAGIRGYRVNLWRLLGGVFLTAGFTIAGFGLADLLDAGLQARLALSRVDGELLRILGCVSVFYGVLLFAHARLVSCRAVEG